MHIRKLSISIGAFMFAIFLSGAFADNLDPRDPIVGRWSWFNGGAKEFHADGTVTPDGKWRCVDNNRTPRRYIIRWGDDYWIDNVQLLKDEKVLRGHNQQGTDVWARRIGPRPQ
jgi:hypothetical protein